jgi:hypothetical protein
MIFIPRNGLACACECTCDNEFIPGVPTRSCVSAQKTLPLHYRQSKTFYTGHTKLLWTVVDPRPHPHQHPLARVVRLSVGNRLAHKRVERQTLDLTRTMYTHEMCWFFSLFFRDQKQTGNWLLSASFLQQQQQHHPYPRDCTVVCGRIHLVYTHPHTHTPMAPRIIYIYIYTYRIDQVFGHGRQWYRRRARNRQRVNSSFFFLTPYLRLHMLCFVVLYSFCQTISFWMCAVNFKTK